MEFVVAPNESNAPPTLREVFRNIAYSVAGFCREKLFTSRKAVGVTLRLERAAARIDRLMRQFRRGKLVWRPRSPRIVPPEQAANRSLSRKPGLGLPSHFGWLAAELPLTAIYYGSVLPIVMQQDEMQALMRATPDVARTMRPIFRMFGIKDDVLKVPEGHGSTKVEAVAAVIVAEPVVVATDPPAWDSAVEQCGAFETASDEPPSSDNAGEAAAR